MANEAKATQQHARILTHVTERERIIYSRIEQHYAHCTQQEAITITAKPSPANQPSTRLLFVNVPTSHPSQSDEEETKRKRNKTKRIKKKQKKCHNSVL